MPARLLRIARRRASGGQHGVGDVLQQIHRRRRSFCELAGLHHPPTPSAPTTAGIQELCAQCRTLLVLAAPESSTRQRLALAHAAHLRAQVVGLEIYGATVRSEHGLEGVDNLLADSLLNAETLGKHTRQSSEF